MKARQLSKLPGYGWRANGTWGGWDTESTLLALCKSWELLGNNGWPWLLYWCWKQFKLNSTREKRSKLGIKHLASTEEVDTALDSMNDDLWDGKSQWCVSVDTKTHRVTIPRAGKTFKIWWPCYVYAIFANSQAIMVDPVCYTSVGNVLTWTARERNAPSWVNTPCFKERSQHSSGFEE